MSENRGLQTLEERVIRNNLCTMCGACSSLCPYLRSWQGRIVTIDECKLAEGRCFDYCPRTEVDLEAIHQAVFGKGYRATTMGLVKSVMMARAKETDVRKRAQTGGAVSAIMDFALREGIIDAAVLTHRDTNHLPEGHVVRDREEVLACAGSSYVAGSTLEAFNREPWDETERIGIVGIPCQVLALGKMRVSVLERRTPIERINLVVGLFCNWALTYEPFISYLKDRVSGAEIQKLDITPPPDPLLRVILDKRLLEIPLHEIRPFIRPTCSVCLDMTSELSDLSVGTAEGVEGWNTVIVRTEKGEELFSRAEAAGIVETSSLPEENLRHLKEASLLKKQRALSSLNERGELKEGYLILSSELIQKILSESVD